MTILFKVRKRTRIRNRYNPAPDLTQEYNGKVTTSQLDITNESQEVSPFPAGDHKASINRRAQKHNKYKTEIHKRSTTLEQSVNVLQVSRRANLTLSSDVDQDKNTKMISKRSTALERLVK